MNQNLQKINRIRSVDIGRGFAILCMVANHIVVSFWVIGRFGGIIAAPIFLFIAGISFEFYMKSRIERKTSPRLIFLESFSRSIFIYSIPLIPYILVSASLYNIPGGFTPQFIHWGVFQVIAVGYILGFFLYRDWKLKVTAIFLIFLLASLIQTHFYFFNFLISDYTPVFPWVSYFIMGQLIYEVYKTESFSSSNLLILALISVISSIVFFNYSNIPFEPDYRNLFPTFLLLSSIFFLIQSIFIILVDRLHKCEKILNPLERVGKIAFSAYYIHYPLYIVAGLILITYNFPSFFVIPSILLIILILAVIESYWEKYNYIFSLEWIFRNSSNVLYKWLVKRFPA